MNRLIHELLLKIGEDPNRTGLKKTPKRFEDSLKFLTKGYKESIEEIIKDSIFDEDYSEMVLVRNIEFYSLCEHHLLPFYGKCHIGYIPDGKIIGLSKLPRIVDVFARRLQVQERLTREIADTIQKYLKPMGVGVVMEAYHLCMAMRGVEKKNAYAVTSALLGVIRSDRRTRAEFLTLIQKNI
ncbi:MAG: GTP cyclohydrolase I FolE [Candidatus Hydrogenedentota bacterium]